MALAAAACGVQTPTANAATENRAQTGLEETPLIIQSARGAHRFIVEVARTPEQQATGMMFRQSLAPDRGMLFPYDPPQAVSFWMKNTLIPLDIIFIRADGTIARIATAKPLDLTPVPSLEPVSMVLEIAGGRAAELGIQPGDRVAPRPPCCKEKGPRTPAAGKVNPGGPPMNLPPPPVPPERGR